MVPFQLAHLDHVAITAADPAASVAWYQRVLGLKKMQLEAWGEFPIFMLAGQVGVAIFKADTSAQEAAPRPNGVRIDHFAFHVSQENFAKARQHYTQLGLTFTWQDHQYFHSIYTQDPDGHTVELTTLVAALPADAAGGNPAAGTN